MRKLLLYFFLVLVLSSCQRGCERWKKKTQFSKRTYEVVMYSGGDTVFHDRFTGILNDNDGSDGFYYSKGDTLIEISGDYIVKSVD